MFRVPWRKYFIVNFYFSFFTLSSNDFSQHNNSDENTILTAPQQIDKYNYANKQPYWFINNSSLKRNHHLGSFRCGGSLSIKEALDNAEGTDAAEIKRMNTRFIFCFDKWKTFVPQTEKFIILNTMWLGKKDQSDDKKTETDAHV